MKISTFFATDYVDAASYDSIRKLASYNDGLKNSGRKALWAILQKNLTNGVKVSRLASTVSEFTEYLHAEDSLQEVLMKFPKRYPGTNNMPLLRDEGNFGKRFKNESSAARYVFTALEDYTNKIFMKVDDATLVHQEFEGMQIEPKYLVPILPNILINGSIDAITTGFTQQILSRPTAKILKMTKDYIKNGKVKVPDPGWSNWDGYVKADPKVHGKWFIYGKYTKRNSYTLTVTELPVGIDLATYVQILADLVESKVITSYEDKSRDEKFNFIVKVPRKFFDMTEEKTMETLGLRLPFTEKYNCIGLENDIVEFKNLEELFYAYAVVREKHYTLRKEKEIERLTKQIKENASKYLFIKGIVSGTLIVSNRTKKQIVVDLEKMDGLVKREDSFDYLLNMSIYSLTTEKMNELREQINGLKVTLDFFKNVSEKELWSTDLDNLTIKS